MGFYEFQCGFLATICASLKLAEYYVSRKSGTDGSALTISARDGAASALSRKYLIVYGLAMGTYRLLRGIQRNLMMLYRRGLAARPIWLLVIRGPVWV